jgi:hypothetical protein
MTAATKRGTPHRPIVSRIVSGVLVISAILGLVSGVIIGTSVPTVPFHSPTATHTGYFSISYTGVYHYVVARPLCDYNTPPCGLPGEVVWFLTTVNATIRLIFYCGNDFCSGPEQLPFREGEIVYVKGTLLTPSEWPTNQYRPALEFLGDLYVFKYSSART